MELLKFKLFTPTACFKTPFSVKGIETYPLPPYSTIIGLLYTALGRKWQGERFSLSLQGTYGAIFRDYIRFRKYNFRDEELQSLPISVPLFYRFELTVHIRAQRELLEEFKKALEKPSTYLFLSGGEYPVKVKTLGFVRAEERQFTRRQSLGLKADALIPEDIAERLGKVLGGEGIYYKMPFFLKSLEPREHEWVSVYHYPKGTSFQGNILIDEEGDTVWLCGS